MVAMSEKAKRCIYTGADGLANPGFTASLERSSPDAVWAVVGPFDSHKADAEFMDRLEALCMEFNLANGTLSAEKHRELTAQTA
jgi:hypothetical protein